MTSRLATQASALALALVASLATLGGVGALAKAPADDSLLAAAAAIPVQTVVIVGHRAQA